MIAVIIPLTAVNAFAAEPEISKTSAYVPIGYSTTVKVTGASDVKWSSSDESVAEVRAKGASAKIKGKKTGSATISAKVGSTTLKCNVTVKKSFITPSAKKVAVSKGRSKTVTLKVIGSKDITVLNSNKDVCSVSWGKWDDSTINITINGKADGNSTIKVYTKKYLESTVQEIAVTVDSSGNYGDDETIREIDAAETSDAENSREKQVVDLVNKERKAAGKNALQTDDDLNAIAALRAKEIAEKFDHIRPDGTSCFTVFKEADYVYVAAGENIGYEYHGTAESIMKEWMKSKNHKKNILDSDNLGFTKIGVGYYEVDGRHYWVQVFAG